MAEAGFLDRTTDGSKWAFHGEAKLTLLPGVGHNAWDHAYSESNLPEWLLRHNL